MLRSLRARLALVHVALVAATLLVAAVLLGASDETRASGAGLLLVTGLLMLPLALLGAVLSARATTDSLAELGRLARRWAAGDWQARLPRVEPSELNDLSLILNEAAEQVERTLQRLQADEARMSAIVAHMADGLIVVDERETVIQLSGAAEQMLDVRAREASGRSFTQVVRDHEMASCLREAIATQREQTRMVEQSGARRLLRIVATPLSGDTATTYVVVLQDLTQIRRLETIRRDFISNISHELRTPIAALQALTETLSDGALEDLPAARRFVAQMDDEVHRLSQLVNDLLDLSAMEAGKIPLERRPADVSAIVRQAAERLQPQAERAGVRLDVVEAPPLTVDVDGARIEQVVLNLIHNAIKFTPRGGTIECRVAPHDQHVTVSVRDSGVGIGEQDLPRIFERFYKVDRARAGGGTGLGLAIAKHVVELHGGHIWAESREGQGTTMLFTLPTAAA